jgi:hypothetical protein
MQGKFNKQIPFSIFRMYFYIKMCLIIRPNMMRAKTEKMKQQHVISPLIISLKKSSMSFGPSCTGLYSY